MHFRENAERSSTYREPNFEPILCESLKGILESHRFLGGFLCQWQAERPVTVLASSGLPIEPFKGSNNESLTDFVRTCIQSRCAKHLPRLTGTRLLKEIENLKGWENLRGQAMFVPLYSGDYDYVAIGLASAEQPIAIDDVLVEELVELVDLATVLISAKDLANRMHVMELYVREIGHDLASSVQAILAKLRNISRGLINGAAVLSKVREAEQEMMAAYRSADTLGVTVDPDYNLSTAEVFSFTKSIYEVIDLCKSEAEERHIELRLSLPENEVNIWGDPKALQSAMTQLILNAIKYAKGSSTVQVKLEAKEDSVVFTVIDRGLAISDEERPFLWDFGWRGTQAKELHVNGSGIGLYTVRKIVKAHGGSWGSDKHEATPDRAIFYIVLPRRKQL